MPRAKIKADAKSIPLTDAIRHDEPAGYLVFCPESYEISDYLVFVNERDARDAAHDYTESEGRDWPVYPLYASHPLED